MPTVNTYGTQKVATAPLDPTRRTATVDADALGAGTGKALMSAGLHAYQDELLKQDEVAILEADRKISEWENKRLYDPKTGAFTVRGKDAFGLPDTVNQEFTTYAGEIRGSLSTERQRVAFDRMVGTRSKDISNSLNRHVFNEVRKFDDAETENYIKNSRDAAINNSHDPKRIADEIERQVIAIGAYATRHGLGTEYVKQKTQQAMSDTHVGVVDRMLANGQDQTAAKYYEVVKSEVHGKDKTEIENKLKVATVEGGGQRNAISIWEKLGPRSDLDPVNLDKLTEEARRLYSDDPRLLKATTDALKERAAVHNASQRERRESGQDAVWRAVEGGASLASIRRMPEYLSLPGHDQVVIKNHIIDRAYTLGQRAKQGDGDLATYYTLSQMASTPSKQAEFANLNLLDYRGKLSAAEFRHFADLQGSIRKGDVKATDKLLASERVQNQIVNDAILGLGLDPTPDPNKKTKQRDEVLLFRRTVRDSVASHEQRVGRNATDKEVQDIVDNLVVKGHVDGSGVGGFFRTERRVYQLQEGENLVLRITDVPKRERDKIEGALRRAGRQVTDEAVTSMYQAKLLRDRGAPAQRSMVDQVPR